MRDTIRHVAVRRQKTAVNVRVEAVDAMRTRGPYVDACKAAEDVWVAWGGEAGYTEGWAPVWWRDLPTSEYPTDDEAADTIDEQVKSPLRVQVAVDPVVTHKKGNIIEDATAGKRARLQADAGRINNILMAARASAMVRVVRP